MTFPDALKIVPEFEIDKCTHGSRHDFILADEWTENGKKYQALICRACKCKSIGWSKV